MPYFIADKELREGVKPLSKKEIAWINRLEKTLLACPTERLGLVSIGDPDLQVIDDMVANREDLDLHDNGPEDNQVLLANVNGKVTVHSGSA